MFSGDMLVILEQSPTGYLLRYVLSQRVKLLLPVIFACRKSEFGTSAAANQSSDARVKHTKCSQNTHQIKSAKNIESQPKKIKRSNSIFSLSFICHFSFRPDNSDHIIDVNRNQNNPFEYDQVNIICPNYSKGTRTDQAETYIIYNVS